MGVAYMVGRIMYAVGYTRKDKTNGSGRSLGTWFRTSSPCLLLFVIDATSRFLSSGSKLDFRMWIFSFLPKIYREMTADSDGIV